MSEGGYADWSTERLLEENLLQCKELVGLPQEAQERAFRNIKIFIVAHALQRGLRMDLARREGARFEELSRALVHALSLLTQESDHGR